MTRSKFKQAFTIEMDKIETICEVTLDGEGNILVADQFNHQFTVNGQFLALVWC